MLRGQLVKTYLLLGLGEQFTNAADVLLGKKACAAMHCHDLLLDMLTVQILVPVSSSAIPVIVLTVQDCLQKKKKLLKSSGAFWGMKRGTVHGHDMQLKQARHCMAIGKYLYNVFATSHWLRLVCACHVASHLAHGHRSTENCTCAAVHSWPLQNRWVVECGVFCLCQVVDTIHAMYRSAQSGHTEPIAAEKALLC